MVIILNVDASANNIGQIEIPITYDTDALAYLNSIPVAFAAMSYAKKKAWNNFFKSMKTNGLNSKIQRAFAPLYGQTEGGVNLFGPSTNVGLPAAGANVVYSSKGVTFLNQVFTPTFTITNKNDAHGGAYNAEPLTTDSGSKVSFAYGGYLVGRRAAANEAGTTFSSGITNVLLNHRLSTGAMISSANKSLTRYFSIFDNELSTVNAWAGATADASGAVILGGSGSTFGIAGHSHSYFTFGSSLTTAEATLYSGLITSLMSVITV